MNSTNETLNVPEHSGVRAFPRRLLVGCIHLYQAARAGRPSPCRFIPSCSAYGEEAIAVHGAVRGSFLTMKRIARCRPGGGFGVDLVPPAHRTPHV